VCNQDTCVYLLSAASTVIRNIRYVHTFISAHYSVKAVTKLKKLCRSREYELITEAHAQLSVVGNCSRLSLPVYCLPPPPPATADLPPTASCFPSPRHTRREDLEQFRTTESWAWASIINSYSLCRSIYWHVDLSSRGPWNNIKNSEKGMQLVIFIMHIIITFVTQNIH
jgi:hypothetical protein